MKRLHYVRNDTNTRPVCRVPRNNKVYEMTTVLEDVNCRACLKRMAFERDDPTLLERIKDLT